MNIEVGTTSFSVTSVGDGVPVVFLHAGVTDRRMWSSQMALVAEEGFRAIAYDRRGFGDTISDDVPFNQVEDLEALLDALGVGAVVLVGCSNGGRIAMDFALAHPDRVSAVVLESTSMSGSPEVTDYPDEILPLISAYEAAEEMNDLHMLNLVEAHAWLDGPATQGGRVSGELRTLFLEMNAKALAHTVLTQEELPAPAIDQLHRLKHPILLVSGELDFPHIIERHDFLESEFENAFAAMIEGTAHFPNYERPDLFNSLLLEFLDSLFDLDED